MKRFKPTLPSKRNSAFALAGAAVACLVIFLVHTIQDAQVAIPYRAAGITAPWIPSTVTHWSGPINQMAKKYNIDANLVAIIMTLESGGDAKANSGEAIGLMQITPITGHDIANKYLQQPTSNYDLSNPQTNIEFGVAYLAFLRDQFATPAQGPSWTNTVELLATGYNGGPGSATRLAAGKGLTDTQTVVYSRDAFNMWRERNSSDSPTFDRWKERGGSKLIADAKADQ